MRVGTQFANLGLGLILLTGVRAAEAPLMDGTIHDSSRQAYQRPLPHLSMVDHESFSLGQQIFRRSWVVAPASDDQFDGLGPLHNRFACISCHPANGRGLAPRQAGERLRAGIVRLAQGQAGDGTALPHPVYGDQLNDEAIPGVPAEGRVSLRWSQHTVELSDQRVNLKQPHIEISQLGYGEAGDWQQSLRIGPPVFGLGLLEAVPDSVIITLAGADKPDGVLGHYNWVPDPESGQWRIGRFGYKATAPSLRVQSAKAMQADLGITSPIFPKDNCTIWQTACLIAESGGEPELSEQQLNAVTRYLQGLAVPAARNSDQVEEGRQLFNDIGCALCHRPSLPLDSSFHLADVAHAYTDLLLHDMGPGLADGVAEYRAAGSHWRTAPLWGIGLATRVGDEEQYLHDGRASSLLEAILWHDGEAAVARRRVQALNPAQRQALLDFLRSL